MSSRSSKLKGTLSVGEFKNYGIVFLERLKWSWLSEKHTFSGFISRRLTSVWTTTINNLAIHSNILLFFFISWRLITSHFSGFCHTLTWISHGVTCIPIFLPGEFHGQKSLVAYSPWGHEELAMSERLTLNTLADYLTCRLFAMVRLLSDLKGLMTHQCFPTLRAWGLHVPCF